MSLITETVETVIQADSVQAQETLGVVFTGILGNTKVLTGVMSPTAPGFYLFQDEAENPIQVPTGSYLRQAFFETDVPLVSNDLTNSFFYFNLFDTSTFNMQYQPWNAYSEMTGQQINSKSSLYLTGNGSTATIQSFNQYPYVGAQTSGNAFTLGTIRVYIFYV